MKTTMVTLLVGLSFATMASANIISNGDFETGDFTDWNLSSGVSIIENTGPSVAGTYAAKLIAGNDIRVDKIAMSEGDLFNVSYDYNTSPLKDGGTLVAGTWFRFFNAAGSFLGQQAHVHAETVGWETESFTTTAAPVGTTQFDFQLKSRDANQMWLDNISVDAVPEPTTLSLFGLAAAAMMVIRKKTSISCR